MTAQTFNHMERELLFRISELAIARAARETELGNARQLESAAAEGEQARSIAAAEKSLAAETARIDARRRAGLGEIDGLELTETTAQRARHESELAALTRKVNELNSVIEQERESARWMAETVAEPQEARVNAQHTAWLRSIDTAIRRMEQAETKALGVLGGRTGHIERVRSATALPVANLPINGQIGEIEKIALEAEHLAADVPGHVRPKAAHPVIVGVAGVLGAGIGTAGGAIGALEGATLMAAGAGGMVVTAGASMGLAAIKKSKLGDLCGRLGERLATGRELARSAVFAVEQWKLGETGEIARRRDAEIAAIRAQLDSKIRELDRLKRDTLPRLRGKHLGEAKSRREGFEARRNELNAACDAEHRTAIDARDAALAQADARVAQRMAKLDERQSSEFNAMSSGWLEGMRDAESLRLKILDRAASGARPPEASNEVAGNAPLLDAVGIGSIHVDLGAIAGGVPTDPRLAVSMPAIFELPLMMDLAGASSLIIDAGGDPAGTGKREAMKLVRGVILKLIESLPPARARFTFFDPIGLGQNFAAFMHLADHDPALVSDRIWTDARHFEQRLTDLTEHMENVIQKYLRNEFESIQAYNAAAGEVAEPFRFLVLADFPTNVSEEAARKLESVLTSGPRCGVFTILVTAASGGSARLPSYIRMPEIERSGLVLKYTNGRFVAGQDVLSRWPITLIESPGEAELTERINRAGERARGASRVKVAFDSIAPGPERVWSLSSAEEVRVPIGRAGAKKLQHITLGRGTAQHALIAGRTGSGKSTLFHVIITNLALWYSPQQLNLYLLDFKKGVEFKSYTPGPQRGGLPHARVIAIESEREFGLSVLKRLDAELTQRGEWFREAGVQDVAGYRRTRGEDSLPRILLIVDEFQEFFVEDDRVAQESALLLDRLVRQGRAFGMHIILGSQTLGGAFSIARTTIGQMGVRIALQCGEADSYLILSEDNSAARLLSRPGEAIYNDASGLLEGNSPFQIVWLDEAQRDSALRDVSGRFSAQHAQSGENGSTSPPTIVFEGNAPATIETCAALARQIGGGVGDAHGARVFLGDPVWIKDATSVRFSRVAGANLLIVGQQEDQVAALMTSVLIGLASAHAGEAARIMFFDGKPDGENAIPGELFELPTLGTSRYNVRDAARGVVELGAELARREADAAYAQGAGPAYLLVHALHRFRDLRRSDDFDFSSSDEESPAKAFARIIRDGPPLGVHVICTCDTLANLERTLDRSVIREFGARVALQMNPQDSTALIDAPTAGVLGRGRALLHLVESGSIEKFRSFSTPDPRWLRNTLVTLAARRASKAGESGSNDQLRSRLGGVLDHPITD